MSYPYNIVNWTFWAALLLVAGLAWGRCRLTGRRPGWLMAIFLSVLSCVVVGVALRLVYVAPMAITQDIVAARQAIKGQPLPTTEIQPLVKEALAAEPRPAPLESVWPWLAEVVPGLAKQEQNEYDNIANVIEVQAHPPFATLFMVPFVYFLGVYHSSIALSLLSIGCIGVSLLLLYLGLELNLSASQKVLFCAVFLGWFPMFGVLRSGQFGALLSLFVVAGWYSIRRDRPILAGVAIGLATSLKIFPALLLIYFLLRHRRACGAGVATIVIVNAATIAVFGPQSYLDYFHTARVVTETWAGDNQNWSLLAALHHLGDILGIAVLSSQPVFIVTALLVLAVMRLVVLFARPSNLLTDLEYALFVVAMTFMSPTCWSHYFVVLLLPLTVLANHALRKGASSSLMFLSLFLLVAMPDAFGKVLLPLVEPYVGARASMALVLLPPLALLGMIAWLATLVWTSSHGRDESNPQLSAGAPAVSSNS